MFTKSRRWQRWSGPRADVTAAVDLARLVLQQWSGIPAKVKIRISYSNDLTETSDDPTALEKVHRTDLHRVKDIWIDVDLDSDWWLDATLRYDRRESDVHRGVITGEAAALLVDPPSLFATFVMLRLSRGGPRGMDLDVFGPDRTNVEGLTMGLAEVLNRQTSGPTWLPARLRWVLVWLAASSSMALASWTDLLWNLPPAKRLPAWQAITVPLAVAIVAGTLAAGFAWALPSLELLDTGERSRFQRYRTLLWSGLGAVVAGLSGTAIWTAFT